MALFSSATTKPLASAAHPHAMRNPGENDERRNPREI
jgi:hypothetical protein